jgi:hypothetical protein
MVRRRLKALNAWMNRRRIGSSATRLCIFIVALAMHFVNRNQGRMIMRNDTRSTCLLRYGLFVLVSMVFPNLPFAQAQETNENESELYRSAIERLGQPSRIRWTEPGSNTLQRWEPRRIVEIQGVISEWDPKKLVIVQPTGTATTTFPGDNVIGIEPGWKLDEFAAVHQLFVEKKFSDVIQRGQDALKLNGAPRWQQRLLVTEMVQSASALGKWVVAGRVFSFLAKDEPPDLLLASIPLPWSDELLTSGPSTTNEAVRWIEEEAIAMKLLGAAWSISGPQRSQAIELLKSMAQSDSNIVAGYARAQLWRTVPPNEIRSSELPQWFDIRDGLPLPAQAGPTMLLATRLEQAGQRDLAIAEWMRIPILHKDRFHLARGAVEKALAASHASDREDISQRIQAVSKDLDAKNSLR